MLLRKGNAGSNTAADHISVVRAALKQLPTYRPGRRPGRQVLVRPDAGGCTHAFVEWLVGRRLQYSIGFILPTDFADPLERIPEDVWTPAYDADGWIRERLAAVHPQLRVEQGRNPEPSAGLVDSQTVKGADTVGADTRGYDAGKRINGRKRFIVTDTLGVLRSRTQVWAVGVVPVPALDIKVEITGSLERHVCRRRTGSGTVPVPGAWRVANDIACSDDMHTALVGDHTYAVHEDQVLTVVMGVRHGPRSCAEVHRQ